MAEHVALKQTTAATDILGDNPVTASSACAHVHVAKATSEDENKLVWGPMGVAWPKAWATGTNASSFVRTKNEWVLTLGWHRRPWEHAIVCVCFFFFFFFFFLGGGAFFF